MLYENDKESIQKNIILYLSEYLDLLIKEANKSGDDIPGFEKRLKMLYDMLNAINQI